jgi:hypothetical protein
MTQRPQMPARGRRGLAVLSATAALLAGCSSSPADPSVTITAAGDIGATPQAAAVFALADDLQPDVHLALGDLSYGEIVPETAWCAFVDEAVGPGFPMALLAGNHDSADDTDGRIEAFRECLPNRMPGMVGDYGREYTLDLPAGAPLVRIIAASPGLTFDDGRWDYRPQDRHGRWLGQAIDEARQQGIAWIVVAAHIPCLSVGVHDCPDSRDFTDTALAERVDLVLHGHEHSYGRTHQLALNPDGCPRLVIAGYAPGCVADADGRFAAGRGTVFATVGTGGTALREIARDDPELPYFGAVSDASHGVLRLHATPEELTASFEATGTGGFTDAFTIAKGS